MLEKSEEKEEMNENELTENERRIKDKLEFFMQEKIPVHVQLKDKTFLNGSIEKKSREGIYWLIENKLNGVFLFLRDIFDIEEYREREEVGR